MLKMKDEIIREMNHPSRLIMEKASAIIVDGVIIKNRYIDIERVNFEVLLFSTLKSVSNDYERLLDFACEYSNKGVILINDL